MSIDLVENAVALEITAFDPIKLRLEILLIVPRSSQDRWFFDFTGVGPELTKLKVSKNGVYQDTFNLGTLFNYTALIRHIQQTWSSLVDDQDNLAQTVAQSLTLVSNILNALESARTSWNEYQKSGSLQDLSSYRTNHQNAIDRAHIAGVIATNVLRPSWLPEPEWIGERHHILTVQNKISHDIVTKSALLDKQLEQFLETQESKLSEQDNTINTQITALQSKIEGFRKLIDSTQASIRSELLSDNSDLKKDAIKVHEELAKLLGKNKVAHDALLEEERSTYDALLEKMTTEHNKTIDLNERLAKLNQLEATDTITKQFNGAAQWNMGAAIGWTIIMFAVGFCAAALLVDLVLVTEGFDSLFLNLLERKNALQLPTAPNETVAVASGIWTKLLTRLSLTGALAYLLVYSSRQATRQRNNHQHNKRTAIELAALDAYLSPYSDEQQLEIKAMLLPRYFGNFAETPGMEKLSDYKLPDPSGSGTMASFAKAIAPKKKDDEKEDKKKEDKKDED